MDLPASARAMRRKTKVLFSNVAISTGTAWIAGALVPISTAVAGLILARSLPAADYGRIAFFYSILGMVILFGSLGLSAQITRLVARHTATGETQNESSEIANVIILRLLTATLLLGAALIAVILHNSVLALGIIGGAVVLLCSFALGILQGLRQTIPAVTLQVLPPLVYLFGIIILPKIQPEEVYYLAITSYLPSLGIAVFQGRRTIGNCLKGITVTRRIWMINIFASGKVYLITLIIAFYGLFGSLILGSMAHFTEASAFALALSLTTLPVTAFGLVITAIYYPELCRLVACENQIKIGYWYRTFLGITVLMGILISLFLGFASDTVCTTLFTSKYAFVAPVLTALAPAVLAVSVSQLLVWTLVASNQFRYALIGSSVQFLALVLGGWAVFTIKGNLLQNLALIHTVSATLGVVAFIIFLQKIPPYRLRRARLDAMIWRYRKSGS